jgi:hypothetical protein
MRRPKVPALLLVQNRATGGHAVHTARPGDGKQGCCGVRDTMLYRVSLNGVKNEAHAGLLVPLSTGEMLWCCGVKWWCEVSTALVHTRTPMRTLTAWLVLARAQAERLDAFRAARC